MAVSRTVSVRLTDHEIVKLDELRSSGMSRSDFVRHLLRQAGPVEEVPTRVEALRLLGESARAGRVAAQVALARELREGDSDLIRDWVMNGS